jgi:hypothetical protein
MSQEAFYCMQLARVSGKHYFKCIHVTGHVTCYLYLTFMFCRLLKNSIKLSNSNGATLSRSRGFSRRINVNLPASPLSFDKCSTTHDKENMGCGGAGAPVTVTPEADALPFPQHGSSPSKQICSPSKVRIKTSTKSNT